MCSYIREDRVQHIKSCFFMVLTSGNLQTNVYYYYCYMYIGTFHIQNFDG